ncbi:MAG: four helix bundle protein [Candidatus Daviesbacteria bacterium]|nr:four helix bundle protein [Candidatus Daviesbacteria bacterium]
MSIQSFKDLITWQRAHKLVLSIYRCTKFFPAEERYSLVDQMRRCSISVSSNIAEGFSRKSYKEKVQFYYMALGSTTELENQILVSKDVGYVNETSYRELIQQILEVHKLINGLIKASKIYIKA